MKPYIHQVFVFLLIILISINKYLYLLLVTHNFKTFLNNFIQ